MSDAHPTLPRRPDLRHLRDEAKRRRRSGEFAKLSRAQLAIAREHGFASWPLLKFHVEALTLDVAQRAQALVRSACSFDLRRARALLAADPALRRHDIACAAVAGEPGAIARALERDADAAKRRCGALGWEPILYACFSRLGRGDPDRARGLREVVGLLLAAGADANASFENDDRWLQVPLYGAAGIANDAELTRMLIEAGADPNDAGEVHGVGEALYHACEFADPTCARLLIEAGTDRRVVDYCLGRVLNFPHHEMVAMFCAHGAHASAGNLHQALWRRRPAATVAVLLDAGAPLEDRDDDGLTPLEIATRWGSELETVELLLSRGADPASITDSDRAIAATLAKDAPLAAAAPEGALDEMLEVAVEGGHLDAVRALLRAGAAPDGRPGQEHTLLGQAAWRGRVEIVAELVRHGASLFWEDGSPIGAALHGSRHCQDPEGGPTMQTYDEVPKERYADVVSVLLAAGAAMPDRLGGDGPQSATILAELGLEPPD
jgi:ankyrin repeat protein